MKKLLLLLTCAMASVTMAAAQDGPIGVRKSTDYASGSSSDSRNGGFGIKGGVNFADIRGDGKKSYGDAKNYNSFHAGFYSQFSFSDKFSLQPEILYSRQGFKGTIPNTTGTSTTRLDYIQVPVLLVFNFLDNVSLHVGPQVSLLTKVKEGDLDRKIANEQDPNGTYIYSYSYNSLDYGLSAGLEARVGPARVGGRYTAGFNEIIKDPKNGVSTAATDIKNGAFQVYVGIGITN
ncbi:porin family protein [Hymenobacter guriensis]|uniref:PorT family protein n=1 Tax=Hymenobacter guriensis TaxID=2793065 RepID=A0ABS0L2J2_9BACT|nr:porin family protein [Hymenobacter guriensis]MBG8554336.1 PorT family protein [Hymenobacter guriensis]